MIYFNQITTFLRKYNRVGLLLICLFYLFNGINYLRSQSITTDESGFYNYAKRLVKGQTERTDPAVDNSKTPIIILNLIPRAAEQMIHPGKHKSDWGTEDIMHGRYITLAVSVLVILVAYTWTKQLYGEGAGLFCAFLISLNPNIIALAGLVTTDSYSVLVLLLTFYFLWKWILEKSVKYFFLFCLTVAVAQLIKPSLFHLYVLIPITLLIYFYAYRPVIRIPVIFKYLLIFFFIQWLVINLGYYFYHTNKFLGEYHFASQFFQSVQRILPSRLPVPFPEPFLEELDLSKYYDQLGGGYPLSSFGNVTILGRSSTGGSFWYYYLVSILFKTPVVYFIFLGWALVLYFRKSGKEGNRRHVLFLLMPILYFMGLLSFFYKTQIGIRHIIFIYPFICILCSSIIPRASSIGQKLTISFLSLYLMASVFFYWGNYYPYTNEFLWNKTRAYQIVGVSNLEFNQSDYFVADFLKRHPTVRRVRVHPDTGDFIIRVDDYVDIWNRHTYDWISSIRPYGQVAFDHLLIHVDSSNLKK